MKARKKQKKVEPAIATTSIQDLEQFRLKHGFKGAMLMLTEVEELDQSGTRRWTYATFGNVAVIQNMLAHMVGVLATKRERELAELQRAAWK